MGLDQRAVDLSSPGPGDAITEPLVGEHCRILE